MFQIVLWRWKNWIARLQSSELFQIFLWHSASLGRQIPVGLNQVVFTSNNDVVVSSRRQLDCSRERPSTLVPVFDVVGAGVVVPTREERISDWFGQLVSNDTHSSINSKISIWWCWLSIAAAARLWHSNPGKFVSSVIAVPSAERWTESTCCNVTITIFKNLKINFKHLM